MYGMLVTPRRLQPSRRFTHSALWASFSPGDSDTPLPDPSTQGNLRILNVIDCSEEAMCCQFNKRGTLLAVGLVNGAIKVFKMSEGLCVHLLADDDTVHASLPVTCLRFYPQTLPSAGDLLLATYASGLVKTWHLSTQSCLRTISEDRQTLTATFNSSGTRLLTAGSNNDIYVYDTESKKKINTCLPSQSLTLMNGHRSRIFALTFYPESEDHFLSGGWDNTVQFWDVRSRHSLRRIYGPHVCGDALQIDPNTNQLLTGSWRKNQSLQVWDPETGKLLQEIPDDFRGHCRIYSCRWLDSEHILAAGSEAHMCRVVDRTTLMTTGCLVDLPGGVYSTDVTTAGPSGLLIAVTSRSSVFLLQKPSK
ncbi:uncharacterized protein [Ambystoma mexicanum]|uniref:uncharacterized protein n=1 Tax=Ambystoma mexicanum TaxID=8296 RepID=UPI0037E881D6